MEKEEVHNDLEMMPQLRGGATVLSSGVVEVPTSSGSIPTAGPPAAEVPTGSDVVPTAGLNFATATVIMIDGLDKSNETVAKYLREYHQFATELPIERRIELISDLVRYQDNYAKIEDFIPIGSKEETERFKRKGLRLEQVHTEGQRNYWTIIRLGGSSASYQFFLDLLKHLDREDLNQLWVLVRESLNIRLASSDKEMELWVELKRL
nr:hypothetical protein [Tanacetum cinerariifolium]